MKRNFVMLASMLTFSSAPAVHAQDVVPGQTAHVAEFLDIFNQACLRAFPAALGTFITGAGGEKLSVEEFQKRAHVPPMDQVWLIKGKSGEYIVQGYDGTEDHAPLPGHNPPCAVITLGPAGMAVQEPYRALKAQFAAEKNLKLEAAVPAPMSDLISTEPGYFEMQFTSPTFSAFTYAMIQRSGGETEYRLDYSPPLPKR